VIVLAPAVVDVSEHVPALTAQVAETLPSYTVTVPLGVPLLDVTVKGTVYGCPAIEGSGAMAPTEVVVPARIVCHRVPALAP